MIAIEHLYIACDLNLLLKYFCRYWEATKIFLSNIFSNEIILDKNFPDHGTSIYLPTFVVTIS